MTHAQRALAALAVALSTLLLLPSAATAASNDVIRDLSIEIDIRPDGTLEVTETYDWDFGTREGLGLTRELEARFDHDADHVRVYEYDAFAVTSPTGAPAGVWPRNRGAEVVVDIGAPDGSDDRRTGRQTYVLTYTVEGALNAIRGQDGLEDRDELYWNATGHDWQAPIEQSSVTVRGPADVVDHACYQGTYGATDRCATETATGGEVHVSSGRLDPGAGVTVMAAYPPGTFGDIAPILQERAVPSVGLNQESPAVTAAGDFVRGNAPWLAPVGLAVPVLYGVARHRRGRDQHFADLPPGVLPHAASEPRVEQLTTEPTVAVRFTPPDGLRPAEVGALDAKATTTTHVTATIIDLAVRGYLRLEEAGTNWRGRVNDWTFVATPEGVSTEGLRDYERTLLDRIFRGRRQVRLSQLRNTFAGTTRLVRKQLGERLHATGLVTRPLRSGGSVHPLAFLLPAVFGSVFLFVGFTAVTVIVGRGTAVLGLAAVLLLFAVVVTRAVTRRARYPRTAPGRALHEQSRGFELYLSTAEAHQLRFEEGEDVFSRYLPYAIVYDVAERWAEIFARLEAQGVQVSHPTWYVSPHGFHAGSFSSLGSSLSSFSSTAGTALTSTPGSSGSSGSRGGGGGGGFSGGGGGGGGGGGR